MGTLLGHAESFKLFPTFFFFFSEIHRLNRAQKSIVRKIKISRINSWNKSYAKCEIQGLFFNKTINPVQFGPDGGIAVFTVDTAVRLVHFLRILVNYCKPECGVSFVVPGWGC